MADWPQNSDAVSGCRTLEECRTLEDKGGEEGRERVEEREITPPALWPCADLINRIFSQLDCVDLLRCSLVCKQWYQYSSELRDGWKNEYIEAYNQFGLGIKRETHPPSSTCSISGLHCWCP